MQLIDGNKGLPCTTLTPAQMRSATSKAAVKIIELLANHPEGLHASAIARALHVHEQNIYYHIHNLRKAGVLLVDHMEDTGGGTAKVLKLQSLAYATHYTEMEPVVRRREIPSAHAAFLAPFIENGRWNARIVVGSPDPHGPESARSRDAQYAIDLGLFLGLFLETPPKEGMILDTELTNWKQNLIIVGGPVVNKAAERVNAKSLAPYKDKAFHTKHATHDQENVGVIVKMPNPYAKGKWILLVSGKRYTGTRAAVLTFLEHFDEICEKRKNLVVVEGVDADSDGTIDSVKILE